MRRTAVGAACLALVSFCPVTGLAQGTKPAAPQTVDRTILHVQVILDRVGFSPGVLDGRPGKSLVSALKGFQEARGLKESGVIDRATLRALSPYRTLRPTRTLALTAPILAGPYTNPIPKDPEEQAKLPALGYRSPLEKLAEMFHTTPQVLLALNDPATRLVPGSHMVFPNALPASRNYDPKLPADWRTTLADLNVDATQPAGTEVVVDKSDEVLRVLDAQGMLVAQFPATMGSRHDPLPIGTWKIKGASYNPPFHFNPDLFWDAKDDAKAAKLPPGPNGPGRGDLARPDEAALRDPRHARAERDRPRRKPWLHPADELGCGAALADGEARHAGGVPGVSAT